MGEVKRVNFVREESISLIETPSLLTTEEVEQVANQVREILQEIDIEEANGNRPRLKELREELRIALGKISQNNLEGFTQDIIERLDQIDKERKE